MPTAPIRYSQNKYLPIDQVQALYAANDWSSAKIPDTLSNALEGSHSVLSAWDGPKLVGLGNAISDGHLVVYYPHLLVMPEYQGQGIGRQIMNRLLSRYAGFHMHMLTADGKATAFYQKLGFQRAGNTEPMWIYDGNDH
ncbi:GNAT family N-acetyltransferase [Pelagicoccus sp. SDUM812005]|uniref:GNAT family N-acetyltransferase n=1 Tax=Pelagicoccus sp. SDUM812005 TaxID=3041257 RepID=UPI00280FAAE4|nr:GNAT family N-acetyltransferase [Pelagicoccus sp. SDUM812005]MDQ8182811.1 GNAT family N-acetyltransferase [Pelagicoccus sp. SDUM812005]